MYPGDEPYAPWMSERECAELEAELREDAQLAKLKEAEGILRHTLLPDALVVWETLDGETFLACVSLDDKPRIEVRWEDGKYIAQAYNHDAILHNFVDHDPAVLAGLLKTWLAQWLGEFLSAADADFYNRR
jgi:hypothetical protein